MEKQDIEPVRRDVDVTGYLEQTRHARRWARFGWSGLLLGLGSWAGFYLEYLSGWMQLLLLLTGALGVGCFLLYLCTTPLRKKGNLDL